MRAPYPRFNLILVGAGLANGVLAWTLAQKRPDLRLLVLESGASLQTPKTWSFHSSDVGDELALLEPLIAKSWSSYDVAIGRTSRSLAGGYHSVKPHRLQAALERVLDSRLRFGCHVTEVGHDFVVLSTGERLEADCVIDGRGGMNLARAGYQKFVGMTVRLRAPHGLRAPMLMDAQVPQVDGYRFFYLLPWSETELLVEDTRYSDTADLNVPSFRAEIESYVARRGWAVDDVLDVEQGVLPIPLSSAIFPNSFDHPTIGVAGGFFHPVTGYSFADAVRLGSRVAELPTVTSDSVTAELERYATERVSDVRYFCALNRMMFLAAEPATRYRIFEKFYELPEATIASFYRGQMPWRARLHTLSGRPPVGVGRAVRALFTRARVTA